MIKYVCDGFYSIIHRSTLRFRGKFDRVPFWFRLGYYCISCYFSAAIYFGADRLIIAHIFRDAHPALFAIES